MCFAVKQMKDIDHDNDDIGTQRQKGEEYKT